MKCKNTFKTVITGALIFGGTQAIAGAYFEVDPGVEIYYEDHGEGSALVLVPGWTFSTEVFEHQLREFSATHRVISFDPRSHGRSTATLSGNNYTTQGADLVKLLDHLNVTNPVLVGWSFGCLATWEFVKTQSAEDVAGHMCIDLSPTPLTGVEGDWVEGGVADIAGFYQAVQTSQGHRDVINWYADEVMIEQEYTPELSQWIVDISTASPPWVASAYLAAGMFSNYMDVAKDIDANIPSAFVVADHWADTAKAYVAQHLPNSQIEAFGGHMMYWEYPDQFNPILAELLKRAK